MDPCYICGKHTDALFRTNPKGEKGKFACRKCCADGFVPIDPEVSDIVEIIAPTNEVKS